MVSLNIEKLLKRKGKSKTWLCDQMDISHYNLNQVINGKTKSISFKYIQGFCKYLDCSPDELFNVSIENDEKEEDE